MSAISAMPGEIAQWLSQQAALADITFMAEYPPVRKAVPLRNMIVAVGIETMKITDSFEENDEGVLVKNEYCRCAEIKIKLSIHAPFSAGGEACHNAFTDVLDCLTFASDFNILESGCGSIESDRDTDSFVLHAWISIAASFCPAVSSSVSFASFINKELLCSSHITNSAIHVSPAQLDVLAEPTVTGEYFGNGAATRTVDVGFAPRLVIVFGKELPPMAVDHTAGTSRTIFAAASTLGGSQGLSITANGFKVEKYTVMNTQVDFNSSGNFFIYIAVK